MTSRHKVRYQALECNRYRKPNKTFCTEIHTTFYATDRGIKSLHIMMMSGINNYSVKFYPRNINVLVYDNLYHRKTLFKS